MSNVQTSRVFFALDELVSCTGDLVAIRSRRLYLTPQQALELSGKLEAFAQRLIDRRATEKNRNLPISEALSLSLGDSCDKGTPAVAKTTAGEIPPLVRCPHEPCSSCVNEFICGLTPVKEILK